MTIEASFKPFTRTVTVPPAWPWDQVRAARLEAQHTSPVSGSAATIIVKRLEPWRLNDHGRFVAVYIRPGDTSVPQSFDVDVQGKRVRIEMPSRAVREAQLRERAWKIGALAAIMVSLAGMAFLSFQRRAEADMRLTTVETYLTREARKAKGLAAAKADAEHLAEAGLRDRDLDQAIADLRYVTFNEDSDARIESFFWNKGYWAVEAGDAPPIKGGLSGLQRSTKPVRRGVWLWAATDRPVTR